MITLTLLQMSSDGQFKTVKWVENYGEKIHQKVFKTERQAKKFQRELRKVMETNLRN